MAGRLAVIVGLCLVLAGCQPTNQGDWQTGPKQPGQPSTRTPAAVPGAQHPVAPPPAPEPDPRPLTVTSVRPDRSARLSDERKQEVLQAALMNLQRVFVCADERLVLVGGLQDSTVVADALARRLSEMGFSIVQTTDHLEFAPSEARQDAFRRATGCDLVFLVTGAAKAADRFGNFWSFEGDLRAKVLNLSTHRIIASTQVTRRGQRATSEAQAAQSAMQAAAGDVVIYLTDEVTRKWEPASLVKVDLVVLNVTSIDAAQLLRARLQERVGVYYVSLEEWTQGTRTARYEVLCRFDVKRFLSAYVSELAGGRMQVQSATQQGEQIRASR